MDDIANTAFRCIESIHDVHPVQWNALLDQTAPGYPFLRHEFLSTLENTGATTPATGWHPAHIIAERGETLVGAAPVYRKHHSFGEFVFDFAWADAWHRIGLHYYPKLVCAVPFTPVVGPRLLAADPATRAALVSHLCALPAAEELSSLHMLFAGASDRDAAAHSGALLRRDCHFRWYNRGYADFEDFLAHLPAKRRKEIRRERKRVREAGISVRVFAPGDIDATLWRTLYAFYARTYHIRGQQPYLGPAFFPQLAQAMPESLRFFIAYRAAEPVGMAYMLVGRHALYGRHWGCAADIDGLHFETCYYAGIEYCIAHGLDCFDAGAQGEHKIRRGFEPIATYSAHVVPEPRLRDAVADFVQREGAVLADIHEQHRAHCAFPTEPDTAP